MTQSKLNRGYLIIHTLVFGAVAVIILGAIIGWGGSSRKAVNHFLNRELAFQIAEAGIEYYRWHLAHAPQDFQDGTNHAGPYVHNYYDQNGIQLGTFTLNITPPVSGSTIVKIVSEGEVLADDTISRSIEVIMAVPSLAKYAVAADANIRFGAGTEIFGPIHSNYGIRFDGLAHNLVSSSRSGYDDPDHNGDDEFGVHTHVNSPPATGIDETFRPLEAPGTPPDYNLPARPDVFLAGRAISVPPYDFDGLTSDLENLEDDALTGYLYASSGVSGYRLVLKTNDTYDLYKVNSVQAVPETCDPANQSGWSSWSVNMSTIYQSNRAFPSNGIIFFHDNVWVEGQINGARLTIAAAKSSTNDSDKVIIVNNDLLYTNYDGTDVIGLIAEGNFNIGMASEDDLRIDAALVSKNGRVGRHYYESPDCAPYDNRTTITLYGMIATRQRYGFAYTDGTGYENRNITYDGQLLYGPPPSFPLTADHYQTISWREL